MPRIPTKAHAVLDYAGGAAIMAAPSVLGLGTRSTLLFRAAAGGALAASALTDYELGVKRVIPMKGHLALDAATGAFMAASPWLLKTKDEGVKGWLPHVLVGASEVLGAALTQATPGDKQPGAQTPGGVHGTGSPSVNGVSTPPPARSAGTPTPVAATPPVDTPGPSVTAPGPPASTTEIEEAADARMPERLPGEDPGADDIETLVADEAAAAAAEAAMIGGPHQDDAGGDPAMEPVYEAGGGEQEGFELAEQDLIENATHGDGGGNPLRDAFRPEVESDASTAAYGDPDQERVSEVVEDTGSADDTSDEGAGEASGPGITHER
ncbi:hypothetical protein [Conexibacter sp. SYSU D00693]|uniref:SPW repeat domain-containing protein n=1 Tax=Conexibacter sp. SYSU D00693 TaxID=2812560 RepID=UPI00196B320B|nr:hypothetical protein [Conexibacter sp. SYSU D00693]